MADLARLLLYGEDHILLHTRQRVLAQQGFAVDTAGSPKLFAQLLDDGIKYSLAVICHSANENLRPRLYDLARIAKVPVYQIDALMMPKHLIGEVRKVLGKSGLAEIQGE